MKERLSSFWESFKNFWMGLSRIARILILCILGGVLVLCLVLALRANQKEYVLLYNDLSTTESVKVLSILSEAGITPRVEARGAIFVEDKDQDRARMQLAQGNFGVGDFGYDTYSPGLTSTQSDKDRLYWFSKEVRLKAMIETYEEVAEAAVSLSVPERNAFALQSDVVDPTATVQLIMREGESLSSAQLQGILNAVRDTVPGLTEDNISISDGTGDLKSNLNDNLDINNAKLQLKSEVDAAARQRVLSIVQPRYGPGNVEVQVWSTLDTDDRTAEKITYEPFDPENPTRNPVDYTEHTRGKTDQPGGVAEGVVGANDNVQTPIYGEEEGEEAGFANYSSHDVYDYLVSSTKEQITKNGLNITDLTVAVVVNARALADGERDQIISLAANAAGVPVEKVSVQNFEFAAGPGPMDTADDGTQWTTTQWLLLAGVILLVLIIAIVIIIVLVSKRRKAQEEEAEEGEILYDENGEPLIDLLESEEDFEPITIVETSEQKLKNQIRDLAESDPEIVANLIKTWLVGS